MKESLTLRIKGIPFERDPEEHRHYGKLTEINLFIMKEILNTIDRKGIPMVGYFDKETSKDRMLIDMALKGKATSELIQKLEEIEKEVGETIESQIKKECADGIDDVYEILDGQGLAGGDPDATYEDYKQEKQNVINQVRKSYGKLTWSFIKRADSTESIEKHRKRMAENNNTLTLDLPCHKSN